MPRIVASNIVTVFCYAKPPSKTSVDVLLLADRAIINKDLNDVIAYTAACAVCAKKSTLTSTAT